MSLTPTKTDESIDDSAVFNTTPVDIDSFLYGKEYLNLSITLSPPQLEFIETLSDIFTPNQYTEGVLMAGQGSGKDTCSIFIGLRIVYLLTCLASPQKYFGMDENGFIDFINIAQNADIARNIYFSTLSNLLRSAPLFNDVNSPSYISCKVTQHTILFPKNIRLISGNSENESWQGYTPILVVLDEIDAFKSEQELQRSRSLRSEGAEGVYNTAKALVQSRFPGLGKVICLSWPRFKGSFIQRRFTNGKLENKTYVACKEDGQPYATWEFNPSKSKSDFKEFFDSDETLANARFLCNPPYARDAFIKDSLPILRAFDADIDEVGQVKRVGIKPIRDESYLQTGIKYFIHVDLGLNHSNAAVCVAHQDVDTNVILDIIKVWEPQADKDIDLGDIESFILGLRDRGFRIVNVTYDNYQSVRSLQTLAKYGIPAKYKSIGRGSREAYDTMKDLLYQEKLDGYFDKETIEELLGLDVVYGDKIEARPGMRKDRADAVAGAIHGVLKDKGVVTGLREVGNVSSMFGLPTNDENAQNKGRNPLLTQSNSGWGKDSVKEKIVSSSQDICTACDRFGGIEYADVSGNRVLGIDGAYSKMCLICSSKWHRKGGNWCVNRPIDSDFLKDIVGRA